MTKIIKKGWTKIPYKDFNIAHQDKYVGHEKKGIYALLKRRKKNKKKDYYYNVVYIGMSETGMMGGRIGGHIDAKKKNFSHFSVFEVSEDFTSDNIKELEGLFLTIYKDDRRTNRYNKKKGSGKIDIVHWEKEMKKRKKSRKGG